MSETEMKTLIGSKTKGSKSVKELKKIILFLKAMN